MYKKICEKEYNFLIWIQNHRTKTLNIIFRIITHSCDFGTIWILAALIMIFSKKYSRTGFAAIISLTASLIVCNAVLKNIFKRIRPYDRHEMISRIISQKTDSSFPSGHSSASFAAAVTFLLSPQINILFGVAAVILAILTAFSRLYVGVHYPSDVAAGSLLGIIISIFVSIFIF